MFWLVPFEILIVMVMRRPIFWAIRNSSYLWLVGIEVLITMLMKRPIFWVIRNSSCFWLVGIDSDGYEVSYLLGYNATWSVEIQLTFKGSILPPPPALKNERRKKLA
jgi:hypothetical protein